MSTDRQSPLDADERELARVLRALPAGEPPSSVDAKILAMARDAVVSTPSLADEARPRPRRAPRIAWGLGVAASCVLAAGLVYRMGGFGTAPLDDLAAPESAEVASDAAREPAPAMPEAMDDSVRVDLDPPNTQAAPAIAPPAAASDAAPVPLDSAEASAAVEPPMQREERAEQQALEGVTVTRARVDPDGGRPVAEDGGAGAQAWIQRIRARIDAGDLEGARASLEAFVEHHPDAALPPDLVEFRQANAD